MHHKLLTIPLCRMLTGDDDPPELLEGKRELARDFEALLALPWDKQRSCYRRLALKYHPDNPGKQYSKELFQELENKKSEAGLLLAN